MSGMRSRRGGGILPAFDEWGAKYAAAQRHLTSGVAGEAVFDERGCKIAWEGSQRHLISGGAGNHITGGMARADNMTVAAKSRSIENQIL